MDVQRELTGNVECDSWYQLVPLLQAVGYLLPITKFHTMYISVIHSVSSHSASAMCYLCPGALSFEHAFLCVECSDK